MSEDEKFDQWLSREAHDYNRPSSEIPRDDMWAAIERGSTRQTLATPERAPVGQRQSTARRSIVWWQLAAALLLVAVGIGIGRQWRAANGDAPAIAAATSRLAPPLGVAAESAASSDGFASHDGRRGLAKDAGPSQSYDVATTEHLSRAEALLTSFRAQGGSDSPAAIDRWARDLLGDTRLLLDSPAASDARRRQLLEDLELVLAQIVQLPAETSADRTMVQRSIERGAVLSRLRSTIPAGYTSGT